MSATGRLREDRAALTGEISKEEITEPEYEFPMTEVAWASCLAGPSVYSIAACWLDKYNRYE